MPYINEDGSIDNYLGEITKCDRCGKIEKTKEESLDIDFLWKNIYFGIKEPNLGIFCLECSKAITPLVYSLRDIEELKRFVNKLKRTIDEKRKQRN